MNTEKPKQQTAVDWLEQKLNDRYSLIHSQPLFEQAKEIEKKQILNAHKNGSNHFEDLSANEYYIINFTNDSIDPD